MKRRAFTLIELLVVIAVIAVLMSLTIPVLHRVREQARDTVCKAHLKQMETILKTYMGDHDSLFPGSGTLYHAGASFDMKTWSPYWRCCRWHDARTAQDGEWLRANPQLRGSLSSYIGNKKVILCEVGKRANRLRGCWNTCSEDPPCSHDPSIPIDPQYSYSMNSYLGTSITTSGLGIVEADPRSFRSKPMQRVTQVSRSAADVFLFGEQNSWAVNQEGKQPRSMESNWSAPYNLSGKYYQTRMPPGPMRGTLRYSGMKITASYRVSGDAIQAMDPALYGDCFATYHGAPRQDFNAGYSFVVMLDGHVQKVTVADQLRQSRRISGLPESRLGPGGNLHLAWPSELPPPGGWVNQ